MSGGHFNYVYFNILELAEDLQFELDNNCISQHSECFSQETTERIKSAQKIIELSGKIAKEIEWLYSGDTSEKTFTNSIEKLLENFKNEIHRM